jgi:hypothetical protein
MGQFEDTLAKGYEDLLKKPVWADWKEQAVEDQLDPSGDMCCDHPECAQDVTLGGHCGDCDTVEPSTAGGVQEAIDKVNEALEGRVYPHGPKGESYPDPGVPSDPMFIAKEVIEKAIKKDPRIEEEAHDLVFGDRQAAYGHPSSDFTAMGRITAALLGRWLESLGLTVTQRLENDPPTRVPDIAPEIVALIMTAVKLSRQSANPKRDNLVDLIGYTLCADRIIEGA